MATASGQPSSHPRSRGGALAALAVANVRFWPTVAPHAARELLAWHAPALAIPDAQLRELALAKQRDEHFNAQVAATLATLAPRPARPAVTNAIVALELLFDYLDGRTELPSADPLGNGERMSVPLVHCLEPSPNDGAGLAPAQEPDAPYLDALASRTREQAVTLPALANVAEAAAGAARRCAEAQVRLHAAATFGDQQLQDWATEAASGSGLGWREHLAGSASSVLAMHALIAAAADPATRIEDAGRLDRAYLAIAAVITLLDSLVDSASDLQVGQPGVIRLYRDRQELANAMQTLTREALARVSEAPRSGHHAMTLAGVVAYWSTDPAASDPEAREIVRMLRHELSPTIWPALGVMRAWRAAKRTHSRAGKPRTGNRDATGANAIQ